MTIPPLVLVLLLESAPAAPASPPTVTATDTHPRHVVAVTISPLHLVLPVVELTGEMRVHDKVGVAVVAGAGKVSSDTPVNGMTLTADVWELGAQGRYYVLGDFRHGMQLGAEVVYMHLSASQAGVSAVANGFSVGPFAGYKYTADIGFTFDGQIGYQRIGIGGKASNGASGSESENAVLLNLNVGWSF